MKGKVSKEDGWQPLGEMIDSAQKQVEALPAQLTTLKADIMNILAVFTPLANEGLEGRLISLNKAIDKTMGELVD